MATNDKRRQKKLERRNAKRKEKQRTIAQLRSRGLGERFMSAAGAPILDCLMGEEVEEFGIGQAVISRQLPSGEVAFAFFLIDRYCLGIKDAFGDIRTRGEYRELLEETGKDVEFVKLSPANLRCAVEEAVEYARDLGLEPHSDYRRVKPIFGDIDPQEATEHLEFGKEGKPFFCAGPHDDLERCYRIMSMLEDRCGKNGFNYMLPIPDSDTVTPEDGQLAVRIGYNGRTEDFAFDPSDD